MQAIGTIVYSDGSYSGFLGNVMFQTAATMGIAIKNNMNCLLPYKKEFDSFKGPIPVGNVSNAIEYQEPHYHYQDVLFADKSQNVRLKGYFQSEKYWKHCEPLIRQTFEFNDDIKFKINSKYNELLTGDKTLVSVHVRRGDYLNHPNHHPVMPVDYFRRASQKVKELAGGSLCFMVMSDDMSWCYDNLLFVLGEYGTVSFISDNSPAEDMFLQSLCSHNIISNSSFSWWGSYLNKNPNKIIIAPQKDKWYGSAYAHLSVEDLYLPSFTLV